MYAYYIKVASIIKTEILNMTLNLNYTKTIASAVTPQRYNETCVGYQLFAPEKITIPPHDIVKIDTGIVFEMQGSFYAQIESLPEKSYIVLGGVVDPSYRGSIIVALFNLTNVEHHIFAQGKIAQIIFLRYLIPKLIYSEEEEEENKNLETRITFTKTCASAYVPERFENGSVGYDLHALKGTCVKPLETVTIDTGIILEMQGPFYGQIRDKSGFSTKKKLHVLDGIIDASYQSSIFVHFKNLSSEEQHILTGEKIAQIIFLPVELPSLKYKTEIDVNTLRGTRGFQSGGVCAKW